MSQFLENWFPICKTTVAIVSLLLPMLIKLKSVKESDKGTAGKVTRKMLKKSIMALFLD